MPDEWADLFDGHESVLQSHRGWDPGTAELAAELGDALEAPVIAGLVTRLLVDLNRSRGHPRHFSEFSRKLSTGQREMLTQCYWRPHWDAYRRNIEQSKALLHIACHSFTPELDGQRRNAEIGLLYDPTRARERHFARALSQSIRSQQPDLRVRMNYPYRGTANGLGQQHRRWFLQDRLLSIELEVNCSLVVRSDWAATRGALVRACCGVVGAL